jgi:uncharacterized protein (TIGR01777 family)
MKIAIAGASGTVGTALMAYLTKRGHSVTALKRDTQGGPVPYIGVSPEYLQGFDAVINLSGENIAGKRWTGRQKKLIRDSRIDTTNFFAGVLAKTKRQPTVFINASAIGFYGDRGSDVMTEASRPGAGFLPSVCKAWEAATDGAYRTGLRVVIARFGIVISKDGGALNKMLPAFRMGGGGILGSGQQYMSWISINDVARAIEFLLTNETISGPVNLVAPNPVTNAEFTKTLGKVLVRPTLFRVKPLPLKIMLGEMAREMLLEGNRVQPEKLEAAGFKFEFPTLQKALEKELKLD